MHFVRTALLLVYISISSAYRSAGNHGIRSGEHPDGHSDGHPDGLDIDVSSYRRYMAAADAAAEADGARTTPTSAPDLSNRRIFNADESVTVQQFPFMAAVLLHDELWCSGVVLDSKTVLTAAHCLQLQYTNRIFHEYLNILTVRVGSSNSTAGGLALAVTDILYHPKYDPGTLAYNAAVLVVNGTIPLGGDLPVDAIPYARTRSLAVGSEVSFLGWGAVKGGPAGAVLLQRVRLPVYDSADCREVYGRQLVTNENFCAGFLSVNKNVCNHDAGGPAVRGGTLAGLLSFSNARCDQLDRPAVFSAAEALAPWLDSRRRRARPVPAAVSAPSEVNRKGLGDLQDWMNQHNLL